MEVERAIPKPSRLGLEYLLVLIAAGILYTLSVAPGVLWQDSGMAQIRVVQHDYVGRLGLALAHPLYYLIAQGFQWLPFRESAFKTNLVSTTFATLTVANLYLFLSLLLRMPFIKYCSSTINEFFGSSSANFCNLVIKP